MAYEKCVCVDDQTVITAKMLNDLQDAVCGAEKAIDELKKVGAVLYTDQELVTEQQAQARENIGAQERTHWDARTFTELMPETTFAGPRAIITEPIPQIPLGEYGNGTFRVVFDGLTYDIGYTYAPGGETEADWILAMVPGVPFTIHGYYDSTNTGSVVYLIPNDANGQHTAAVYIAEGELVTIPEKFLPPSVQPPLMVTVTATSEDGETFVCTADHAEQEIVDAHKAGRTVTCKLLIDGTPTLLPLVTAVQYPADEEMTIFIPVVMFGGVADGQTISVYMMQGEVITNVYEQPTLLPNPNALIIDGQTYDGSETLTVYTGRGKSVLAYRTIAQDDTEAFQAALAENRVVCVPGGEYVISDTLVIRENCCLELSQDTILKFTQTSGNCIEMRGSAVLRGNHAVISAAFGLTGNVISMDTSLDGVPSDSYPHNSIPPYEMSDPMFKRQRFVYDVNIIKPNSSGYNRAGADGKCNGTAIYMHCDGLASISWMWGIVMSGVRIAGGFSYGIRAYNVDKAGKPDSAWNHDMRIEAVIEGCEVGVELENCNGAHLNVTIQPNISNPGSVKYAKQGVVLRDCRFVDMMRSRIWDWEYARTDSVEYQHIALYGSCRGLLLDDFFVTEHPDQDIRDQIYTDTPGNFDTMTILQEPASKWFKSVDNAPYFYNGVTNRKLMLAADKFTAEQAEFIHPADGYYTHEDNFTNLAKKYGYEDGKYLVKGGLGSASGYVTTGFIPIDTSTTNVHTYRIGGEGIAFKDKYYQGRIEWYNADKQTLISGGAPLPWNNFTNAYYPTWVEDETVESAFITDSIYMTAHKNAAYFRISVAGKGENLIITVDEKQDYKATWHGEPKRLDESLYAQNVYLTSPSGKAFRLTVSDSGALSAAAVE